MTAANTAPGHALSGQGLPHASAIKFSADERIKQVLRMSRDMLPKAANGGQ
jgi:hypothetical protein